MRSKTDRHSEEAEKAVRWYERHLERPAEALEDGPPAPRRVWNSPLGFTQGVLELAPKEPELSPRELAVSFVDQQRYFVSEASVYLLLKAHDLHHQSGLHPDEGGRHPRSANQRTQKTLSASF